jgi:hypothetical protein
MAAALALAASAQVAEIELTTDRSRYAPGDRVIVSLVNRASTPVWYNPCPRELQLHTEGTWVTVVSRPASDEEQCIALAYRLEPGMSAEDVTPLDSTLAPGRYRLRYAWVSNGAVTEEFRVKR